MMMVRGCQQNTVDDQGGSGVLTVQDSFVTPSPSLLFNKNNIRQKQLYCSFIYFQCKYISIVGQNMIILQTKLVLVSCHELNVFDNPFNL